MFLLRHWFQPGDIIRLEGRHFDEFFRLLPWSDLATGANTGSDRSAPSGISDLVASAERPWVFKALPAGHLVLNTNGRVVSHLC